MNYIVHLPIAELDAIIDIHDSDIPMEDINTDIRYSNWTEFDGVTQKHERLVNRRKRLKEALDRKNGLI